MGDKDERTEAPTAKKRGDARKEGNVFLSRDVVTVAVLFGVFSVARLTVPVIYRDSRLFLKHILRLLGEGEPLSPQLYMYFLTVVLRAALPLLLTALLLGILGHLVQTRFNVSFRLLTPRLSRFNPINGFGRIFSLKNLVELLKNLLKTVILIYLLYTILRKDVLPIARMIQMDLHNSASSLFGMLYDLIFRVCGVFLVIAMFDFMFQRWQYERDLRMTKQEVKDEFKQTEGNPEIKGRIRNVQRQRANRRMMQQVPEADVIIRNPTHLSVALKYDPEKNRAPVVLAKGQDELALRIARIAEEHGIPAIENKELARAMYPLCEPGREIPPEFYGAIAEILVHIYRQQNREELLR